MKRYLVITISVVVLIVLTLILPVLITQLIGKELRSYQGVRLEDTSYQEISFQNPSQGIKLGGMLFVPDGEGPFPAAVIIHGSGTSRRDNRWYLTLTQYLQDNGVAVLLPDKRGSEQSEGDWRTSSFEDLATDTLGAIAFLEDQDDVPISYIGVIGMSQGGSVAPIVANKTTDVAFLVNMVGPAVTAHEQLLYEENYNLREIGFLPGISNILAFPSSFFLTKITQKEFWNAIGNFDPIPYWEKLATSSLVLYGQEDTNVPSEESAARLRSLNKSNIEVRIYEGSGHALQDPEGECNSIIRNDALRDILNFINIASGP